MHSRPRRIKNLSSFAADTGFARKVQWWPGVSRPTSTREDQRFPSTLDAKHVRQATSRHIAATRAKVAAEPNIATRG